MKSRTDSVVSGPCGRRCPHGAHFNALDFCLLSSSGASWFFVIDDVESAEMAPRASTLKYATANWLTWNWQMNWVALTSGECLGGARFGRRLQPATGSAHFYSTVSEAKQPSILVISLFSLVSLVDGATVPYLNSCCWWQNRKIKVASSDGADRQIWSCEQVDCKLRRETTTRFLQCRNRKMEAKGTGCCSPRHLQHQLVKKGEKEARKNCVKIQRRQHFQQSPTDCLFFFYQSRVETTPNKASLASPHSTDDHWNIPSRVSHWISVGWRCRSQ